MSASKKEHVAEALADHIVASTKQQTKNDAMQSLIEAITAVYGSLERFYEDFYQFLDNKTIKEFGALVDEMVNKKKAAKANFASIISSELFKKIVSNFAKVKVGLAGEANHALPISPYSTAIPNKRPKGKTEKGA